MYKLASQQQLRFQTSKGSLSVEQLWDLSLTDLDNLAVKLQSEYETSGKKSFLERSTAKDKTAKLRFDIVLDVLNTKAGDAEAAQEAMENKAYNEKIDALIAAKEDQKLSKLSVTELKKLRKK